MTNLDKELKRQAKCLKLFCFYFVQAFSVTSYYNIGHIQNDALWSIVAQMRASAITAMIFTTIIYIYLLIKDSFSKEESNNDEVKND